MIITFCTNNNETNYDSNIINAPKCKYKNPNYNKDRDIKVSNFYLTFETGTKFKTKVKFKSSIFIDEKK